MKKQEALNVYFGGLRPMSIQEIGILANHYYETRDIETYGTILLGLRYCAFLLSKELKVYTKGYERVINAVYTYLIGRLNDEKLNNVSTLLDFIGSDFEQYIISEVNNDSTRAKITVPFKPNGDKVISSKSSYKISQEVNALTNK